MTAFARRASRLLCLAATLLLCAGAVHATDPMRTLAQLHHGALRAEDGAPVDSPSMAQTEDGWLWFASRMGLFRYDGFEFEKFPLLPPASNESEATWVVYAAPGGDLWVARAYGGVARVRNGVVTFFGADDGLPDRVAVNQFATDGDGVVWANTEAGYFRFDGKRWNNASAWGLKGDSAQLLEDPRGNLWAATDDGIFILKAGSRAFVDTGIGRGEMSSLLLRPDGSLWRRSTKGVHPLPGAWGQPFAHGRSPRANSNVSLFDRDNVLWAVACTANLCRLPPAALAADVTVSDNPATQRAESTLGLTSLGTITALEDRDGDIWISTKAGFDIFRDSWLSPVRFPRFYAYFAVFEDGAGKVWSGTSTNGAYGDELWSLTPDPVPLPKFEGAVTSALRDDDGSVWLGGVGQLWRKPIGGDPVPMTLPADAAERHAVVHAIGRDGAGRLWVSLRLRGLFARMPDGAWVPASAIRGLTNVAPAVIHIDPHGRAWFGYQDGSVAVLDGMTVRRYGAAEHLELGPVTAIATIGDRLIVGSEHGMSVLEGDSFRALTVAPMGRLNSVTGIVRSADGGVWAYGIAGVMHISPEAWATALDHPSSPVEMQLLTMEDGVPGPPQLVRPLPTVLAASDGKLWFAGSQGLAWLDPARPLPRVPPPPVVVRSIASGSTVVPRNESVVLLSSRDLTIGYTALAPGRPRGLMFRHRMEGVDEGYVYAGAHREASYADLAPGHYRFTAEASYDGRHWSRSEPVDVQVPARLFERLWFQLTCLALLALAVWFAHRWRVRLLTRRLRARLDERHRERERIARDLHDTLLQGVQGLILRFQAFADGLSKDDRSRATLERTIDRAEALLVEGRDRVKGLRTQASEQGTLESRIAAQAEDMEIPVHVEVHPSRTPRPVNPVVIDELHSIVREAMVNAMQHSRARSVRVSVHYARRWLSVSVTDDGDGFDASPSLLPVDGHYGIVGMRERAARMRGKLDVASMPGHGATVTARVPGRVAYARGVLRTD